MEVQKAWHGRTFMDFGQASPGQHLASGGRGGSIRRAAPAWGLAKFGQEVFCPWRPLEVIKPWQARTFAAAELAPSMTLKLYWVQKHAKPPDPNRDAYYGSWESSYVNPKMSVCKTPRP